MTSAEKYVTKQIVASQKFLLGLLSLPSFRDIETKQALGLFKVVDKYSGFTSQQSANILQQLDEKVWSAETLKTLREKLAEKTIAPEVTVQGSRRVNQDYLALPNYLTKELWRAIQDESQSRDTVLQQLVSYSGLLGLRCPTEYSAAMLVVLAYGPQMVTQRLGPTQKFELYKQRRPQMKKWFLQMLPPVLYLEALPALPQELPVQIRQLVLSDGQDFVPPLYSYANLLQIANAYPVRGTNMEVAASQAHVVAGAWPQQQLASTAVALGQAVAAAAQMLVPKKPETNVSLPGFQLNPKKSEVEPELSASSSAGLQRLALEDDPNRTVQQTEEDLFQKKQKPAEKESRVTEALDALKASMHLSEETAEPELVSVKKKPAAKRSNLKRPAASTGSKDAKPKQAHKRPASRHLVKHDKVAQRPGQKGSRKERREKLLQTIPTTLLRQFRNGCATCRYQENCCTSCWVKRGFTLD